MAACGQQVGERGRCSLVVRVQNRYGVRVLVDQVVSRTSPPRASWSTVPLRVQAPTWLAMDKTPVGPAP